MPVYPPKRYSGIRSKTTTVTTTETFFPPEEEAIDQLLPGIPEDPQEEIVGDPPLRLEIPEDLPDPSSEIDDPLPFDLPPEDLPKKKRGRKPKVN